MADAARRVPTDLSPSWLNRHVRRQIDKRAGAPKALAAGSERQPAARVLAQSVCGGLEWLRSGVEDQLGQDATSRTVVAVGDPAREMVVGPRSVSEAPFVVG